MYYYIMTSRLVIAGVVFLMGAGASAKSGPVTSDVKLSNGEFSALIYKALDFSPGTPPPKGVHKSRNGLVTEISVADGFTCAMTEVNDNKKQGSRTAPSFSCVIKGNSGWSSFGMNTYGCGNDRELAVTLFDALQVPPDPDDTDFESKTIVFNVPDEDEGTERNQIVCFKPTPSGERMGFRPTCQIINAL